MEGRPNISRLSLKRTGAMTLQRLKRSHLFVMLLLIPMISMAQTQYTVIPSGGTAGNTNGTGGDPVCRYYNSIRYQVVYTAAELSAAGIPANFVIDRLAWNVTESSASLANYTIKVGHTSATNSGSHNVDATFTVKNPFTYAVALGYNDIIFDSPFTWNGTSNLVIEICTGPSNPYLTPYGGVQAKTGISSGSRQYRVDGGPACAVNTSGTLSTKPYVRFTGSVAAPCSGTPSPGNTLSTSSNVCAGASFILSLQNSTPGSGITYQWQVSYDNDSWSNAPGTSTNSTYTATQTVSTYYKAIVYCDGVPGESNAVLVSQNPPTECYCTPTYTTGKTAGDLISNVVIVGTALANNSGTAAVNPAYTYFTGQPNYTAQLTAGSSYQIEVTVGTFGSQNVAAWIDFNEDGVFQTPAERVGHTGTSTIGSNGTGTFILTLPCNPAPGLKRMRVRDVYSFTANGSSIDPCSSYGWGETEDYDVTILPPPPCPAPSNVLSSNLTDSSIDLDWTIGCVETSWQIEYGPTGFVVGSGTVISTSTKPHTLSGLAQSTAYDVYLRADCGGNGISVNTFPISFTTFGPPSCIDSPTSPANGSGACVGSDVTLSWPSAPTATGYDVYLDGTQIGFAQAGTSLNASVLPSGPHTWSVIPVNAYGPATSCAEWNFNIVDPPVVSASNNGPVCSGEPLELTASGTFEPATTFSWSGPNGYSDETQDPTIANIAANQGGNYTVTATYLGCTANSTTAVIVNATPVLVAVTATPSTICPGGSSQLQASLPGPAPYCSSNFTNVTYEFITNVTFGAINNNSTGSTGGPVDYTAQVAMVNAGSSYDLTVSIDPDALDYVYAWFDWNQNGVFTDAGEYHLVASSTSSAGPHTINIPVPANAQNGPTRMRVMVDYNNSTPDPCRSSTYGEAEDYTVNVTGGIDAAQFSWDNAGDLNDPNIAGPIASPSVASTYTVTVLAGNGCSSTGSVPVAIAGPVDDGDPCTLDVCENGVITNTFQDADGDLTCDANDGCPNDPNKIAPGLCGCGVSDSSVTYYADVDGDGSGDINEPYTAAICEVPAGYVDNSDDLCPNDANKIAPGLCGCGLPDADVNNNGICDLLETLPTVQLGVVPAANSQIELQLLPSDFYSGLFSSSVVTVRWITTPGVTLNSASASYVDPAMQTAAGSLIHVGTTTNGIYSYSTFATYGSATLQSAGLYWAPNTIVPFFRVPYTNTSGSCIEFEVLDDAYQSSTNRLWYASLNGVESNNGYISGSTSAEAAPAPDCQNISVTLVDGAATIVPGDITSSFNGCSEVILSLDQTSFDCTNVGENIVTLTIDASGHISTCSATVTVISTLEASATTTPILCNGDLSDVVVTATGGSAPYTGIGTFPTPAGAYTYTVTDDDGCTSTVSGVLTQPDAIDADATSATIPCPGSVTEVTVTATGGTGVLTGTGNFMLPAGIHTFTIEDENGCTEEVQHEVLFVLVDADGDGVCDDEDLCPGSPEPGMSCDDMNAGTINDTVDANCLCAGTPIVVLQLNALLDGPYDAMSGLMNDNLRSAGLVPNAHPYASAPFNHTGTESIDPSVLLVTGDDAIVDWVLLELRDALTPSSITAGRAALIQRDGDIVDLDGTSAVTFLNVVPGSYHVAVRHRNHFGVMTASSLSLDHNATILDLTSAATLIHGSDARKDVAGTLLLWGTNALPDGQLKYTGTQNDRDPILVKIGGLIPTAIVIGYHPEDVNLNGIVSYAGANNDRDPILVNLDGDVIGVRLQQLP